MKRISLASLLVILSLNPALALAAEDSDFSFNQWLDELVKKTTSATTGNNDTTVSNSVNVSANTGGNTAGEGGTVTTGDKTVEVHIRQEVNGEAAEPIDIVIDENSESYQSVKQTENSRTEINVNVSDDAASARATTTIDTTTNTTGDDTAEPSEPQTEKQPGNLITKSFRGIKTFIVNIFQNIFKLFS